MDLVKREDRNTALEPLRDQVRIIQALAPQIMSRYTVQLQGKAYVQVAGATLRNCADNGCNAVSSNTIRLPTATTTGIASSFHKAGLRTAASVRQNTRVTKIRSKTSSLSSILRRDSIAATPFPIVSQKPAAASSVPGRTD